MNKDIRVFIGVPSQESWKADFGMSLVHLTAAISTPLKDGRLIQSARIWNSRGSILPKLRTTLVKQALESGMTHVLFVDSDMVFPAETLHKLLQHNRAVVGCNCPVKTLPSNPTARLPGGVKGEPLYSVPDDVGLKKVWRVGTGVMLVETRVFRNIPEPWFPIEWNPETQDYTGEDWAFCEKLEAAGISIWVDTQLSKHIGHSGSFTFEHKHVEIKDGHGTAGSTEPSVRYRYEHGVSPLGNHADERLKASAIGPKGGVASDWHGEERRADAGGREFGLDW